MKIIKIASKLNIELSCDVSDIPYYRVNSPNKNEILYLDNRKALDLVRESLKNVYNYYDTSTFESLKKRYIFNIVGFDDRDYNNVKFKVEFSALGGNGKPEIATKDHYMYDYLQEHKGGKTGKILYKTPKDAIEEIPESSDLAYRGMSWEEWKFIKKNGFIKSKGSANLGQEGLTFFAPKPSMAQSYASGFAPLPYQITPKTPGVVISVPSKHMLSNKDREDIPGGELAIEGSLPYSEIQNVWFLIAISNKELSDFEVKIPWEFKKGYTSDGYETTYKLDPSRASLGGGVYTLSTSYTIIKKL